MTNFPKCTNRPTENTVATHSQTTIVALASFKSNTVGMIGGSVCRHSMINGVAAALDEM